MDLAALRVTNQWPLLIWLIEPQLDFYFSEPLNTLGESPWIVLFTCTRPTTCVPAAVPRETAATRSSTATPMLRWAPLAQNPLLYSSDCKGQSEARLSFFHLAFYVSLMSRYRLAMHRKGLVPAMPVETEEANITYKHGLQHCYKHGTKIQDVAR